MATDRRTFLAALGGGATLAALGPRPAGAAPGPATYLSARGDAHGGYFVSGFDRTGAMVFDLPLPGRGHSLAVDPGTRRAVAFGRRPATFALVVDLRAGRATTTIRSPDGRHFYGHGVFSPDGRLVYATENDYAGERGAIGVYDATDDFRRVGELPSHGIGPHQMCLLADGTTLAVANGAILTHPGMPRVKLNLPTMKPNLALVDRRDGALLRRTELAPDLHQASIRHIAVAPDGRVAIGMQYQGPAADPVPLAGIVAADGRARLFDGAPGPTRAMRQYCGSIEFDRSATVVATSSPVGGVVAFWDAATGAALSTVRVADGCGLAALPGIGRFLVTDGAGRAVVADARTGRLSAFPNRFPATARWDNHVVATDAPAG